LRKFATVTSAWIVLLFATLAHSQIDIAVGGGTLLSPKNNGASAALLPSPERGGMYPGVSANVILRNRLGLNIESAWRDKRASYYGYETYRPIFTDVNVLFQPRLSKKMGLDLLGGIGISDTRFYFPDITNCGSALSTCYTSNMHFMEHLGIGLHYYVWHRLPHVFVRPEAHFYHIQDNQGFNSNDVLRVDAMIGYTFRH
jgi:hypothetical protein